MSTNASGRNRVPEGVPTGGQFAAERRGEVPLATLSSQPVGNQIDHNGLLAGDSLEYGHDTTGPYAHYRIDRDGDWTYRSTGVVEETFLDAIPEEASSRMIDDEDRLAYLRERQHVIEDFLTERYSGNGEARLILSDDPEATSRVEFSADMDGFDEITEEGASLNVWENTGGHRFYDEMDPGTFGAENAQRLLRQRLAVHDAAAADPTVPVRPTSTVEMLGDSYYADERKHAVLRSNLARCVSRAYPDAAEIVIGREAESTDDSVMVVGVLDEQGRIIRDTEGIHVDAMENPNLGDAIIKMQAHGSWQATRNDERWWDGGRMSDLDRRGSYHLDDDAGFAVVPISDGDPGQIPPKQVEATPQDPFFSATNDGIDTWAPVVNDEGTGYRRDQVTIGGRFHAIDPTDPARAEAITWQESRARDRGEL